MENFSQVPRADAERVYMCVYIYIFGFDLRIPILVKVSSINALYATGLTS